MASNDTSVYRQVYLDTTSAQMALDMLNLKILRYDEELSKANVKGAARMKMEAQRATIVKNVADIEKQAAKGLSLTYTQQKDLVKSLNKELENLAVGSREYADTFRRLKVESKVFDEMKDKYRVLSRTQKEMLSDANLLTKAGVFAAGFAANIATKVTSTIQSAISDAFSQNSQFEKSSQNLSAITGATGADLDFLKKSAVDLSKTGATSATEFVEAFKLIAGAKPELLNAKESLVEVTKAANLLANASGLTLPEAATKLTDALNQFGAPAEEAGKYVDALAAASKYGSAEVPQITEALLQFGSQAKASNIDIYESSAAIELLAEKGVKGAEAGTKLRNVFLALNAVDALDKKAIDALAAAGVNTDVLKNKSLSLEERLTELSKVQNNATALVQIFGKENFNAAQIVLQNIPRYAELTGQIKEQGVASQQAATNTDTLENAWAKFKNVLASRFLTGTNETLKILVEKMTGLAQPTKTAIERFDELNKSVNSLDSNIVPLIDRYDVLTAKTTLSAAEQDEMKSIVSQVTAVMPGARTQFDEYGKAIAISTGRVREYIAAEKDRLIVMNEGAIKEAQGQVKLAESRLSVLETRMQEVNSKGFYNVQVKGEDGTLFNRKATQKEIAELHEYYNDAVRKKSVYNGEVKRLNGTALQEQMDASAEDEKEREKKRKADEAAAKVGEDNKTSTAAKGADDRKKILKEYNDFAKKLNDDINDLLTPEASKKWIAAIKETQNELDKVNGLAVSHEQKQALVNKVLEKQQLEFKKLAEESAKVSNPPLNDGTGIVPAGFEAAVPLPTKIRVQILPEIAPEDAEAATAAIGRLIEKLGRDLAAGNKLDILNANTSKEKRDALLKQLKDEHDAEMLNKDLSNNEKALKDKEYLEARKEIYAIYNQEVLDAVNEVLNYAGQIVGILDQFQQVRNNRENAALKKELQANDVRKDSIRKLEESKVISAQRAKQQLAAIEREEEKRKEELERKQFLRNKKIQIAQALINGAMGVTAVLAARPGATDILSLGAFRAINIGITLASTLASVAQIASQKYGKGGKLTGPSHSNGGMPVINPVTGQKEAEVEGGEYILSKATVANNRSLADALLNTSLNKGGATIKPFWLTRTYQTLDVPAITKNIEKVRFANGGVFNGAENSPAGQQQQPVIIQGGMPEEQILLMQEVLHYLKNPKPIEVPLNKLEKAQQLKARITADASAQ